RGEITVEAGGLLPEVTVIFVWQFAV
ncbi:MAG: hypothetical protein QOG55_55, partial [Acidobacteriaceae bacterium]|nr:hypothetical protein [Acidobacteriaceae bacterium]